MIACPPDEDSVRDSRVNHISQITVGIHGAGEFCLARRSEPILYESIGSIELARQQVVVVPCCGVRIFIFAIHRLVVRFLSLSLSLSLGTTKYYNSTFIYIYIYIYMNT